MRHITNIVYFYGDSSCTQRYIVLCYWLQRTITSEGRNMFLKKYVSCNRILLVTKCFNIVKINIDDGVKYTRWYTRCKPV